MRERLTSIKEMGITNTYLAPIEQIFLGGSVSVQGRHLNSDVLAQELDRAGEVNPRLFVPEALREDFTPDNVNRFKDVRNSKATLTVALLNEDSQRIARESETLPVFELSPIMEDSGRIVPIWKVHLMSRFTGEPKDDPEVLEKLEVDDRWKKSVVLTKSEEGEMFAIFDPELAKSA